MKKSKFRGKNFEFYPSYVVTRVFEKSLTFMDMHHTEKQFIGLEFSESAEFIQKLKSLVLYKIFGLCTKFCGHFYCEINPDLDVDIFLTSI